VKKGVVFVLLAACGSAPKAPPARPEPVVAAAPVPLLVEYVVIHRRWVERLMPVNDLAEWSETNGTAIAGFRHIIVKAKPVAQSIVDRLAKGEEFGKLARQLSEDQESKENGGETAPEKVEPAVREAWAALALGQTKLVATSAGFHVVLKERPSEERLERAYRKAKAPEAAKKLADELLARLKKNGPARAAIAEAVEASLGERAASDADRPIASNVDTDHVSHVRLPAAAKAALETFARSAHAGEVLPSPAVDGDTLLVARATVAR
jgi:hypothetical protein